MKILITGGRGFIGRRLQKELSKDAGNTVCLLVLEQDKDKGDEKLKCVVVGDICDGKLDLSEYDVIYHLAAIANPRVCEQEKELAWKTNTYGTINILERMRIGARIVFMSSAHVYGNSEKPHKEDEEPDPQNFYGFTKEIGERAINHYAKTKGVKRTIFRLFNSYSADQPEGFIVPDVIKKYKIQKLVEILNPNGEIDLVHIDDAVSVLAAASKKSLDGTFNICSGKPMRIREVYSAIRKFTGASGVAEKDVKKEGSKKSLGDNSKISALGFKFRNFSLP